ncbi:hypothetical protein [Rufibacter sp. DG15C]|uniref:hypothetical protein n=1 Tax=Rufibacter sp. DG15C TaxID=1379909 RepID=UPI00082CE1D3|nr:hypothetical protein [Rufibacter sp. DG15C]
MKKLFLLAALVVASYTASAQAPATTPEARAKAMTSSMRQHLGLTGAQVVKIEEINLRAIQQLEQAKKDLKGDPRKLKAMMDQISNTRLMALKEQMTQPQFLKYQQQREKKMGLSTEPGAAPGGAPGMKSSAYDNSN